MAVEVLESEMRALHEAAGVVRARVEHPGRTVEPRVGIVWGAGLGGGLGAPDFGPEALVEEALRAHDGVPLSRVVFPVRVMRLVGVETLIVTGVCTGVAPEHGPGDLVPGDLVLLDDQINLMGDSPLVGPNLDDLGPRFPDMSEPFDRDLRARAADAASTLGVPLRRGVYAGVLGPQMETHGEMAMLRTIGADVVGMSVVPEVIAARHMSMRVLGLVVVVGGAPAEEAARRDAFSEGVRSLTAVVREVVRGLAHDE